MPNKSYNKRSKFFIFAFFLFLNLSILAGIIVNEMVSIKSGKIKDEEINESFKSLHVKYDTYEKEAKEFKEIYGDDRVSFMIRTRINQDEIRESLKLIEEELREIQKNDQLNIKP